MKPGKFGGRTGLSITMRLATALNCVANFTWKVSCEQISAFFQFGVSRFVKKKIKEKKLIDPPESF
jgi:hypothetical protein